MSLLKRKRQLPLLDLHDYEGQILRGLDKGVPPLPPPFLDAWKSKYTAEEWDKIENNYRLAQEIFRKYKSTRST